MWPSSECEAQRMVKEGKLARYQPLNEEIDTKKFYLVDVFSRDWRSVLDAYTVFVPGGLFFVTHGLSLKNMIKRCPQQLFEEVSPPKCMKKRNYCFLKAIAAGREDVTRAYSSLFYFKITNTSADFAALCERSRNNRYQQRLKFTYKIVKSLQCSQCSGNKCVYDALKLFYRNDKKCEREVDYTVYKDNGGTNGQRWQSFETEKLVCCHGASITKTAATSAKAHHRYYVS